MLQLRPQPVPRPRAVLSALLVLLLAALAVPAAVVADPQELPEPSAALEGFGASIEAALEALEVPGLAIAVVVGDEVVLAEGHGLRDVEAGLPVGPETVFAIGSATKSFTTAILGILVDEGAIAWDDPVREHLPDFRLADPAVAERMTVRDLVTHRSGLPRHDLVWYGSSGSRRDLFESLRHLELSAGLRERFQYQNLMYLTAGVLAEEVTGESWEELVRGRLLEPLGMGRTVAGGFEGLEDVARGYGEDDESGELEVLPYRDIRAVGPAGSINSTVLDMAQWLRLQLGAGELDGRRILEPATLAEMHRPQMVASSALSGLLEETISPYQLYGMGWFVQPYRGHHLVHHGGNIDGFSAFVALVPHHDLGVVVLTNKNGTPLAGIAAFTAIDRLLGLEPIDWTAKAEAAIAEAEAAAEKAKGEDERVEGTSPAHPLDDYAGTYAHPAYGELEVVRAGDGLGATLNQLDRLELEHWHYEVFAAPDTPLGRLEVQFRSGLDGRVREAAIALEPTLEPIVFERRPPTRLSDPAFLDTLVGDYALMGQTVTVGRRADELTVTVPGQPTYVLEPHAELENAVEFRLADIDGYRLRFELEEGRAAAAVFIQPNGTFRAERAREPAENEG